MRKDERRQIVRDIVDIAKGSGGPAVSVVAIVALFLLVHLRIDRPTAK